MRTALASRAPVIQMSASPQPRFRKRAPTRNLRPDAISAQFPLFLPQLRVLLVFFYLSLYLSTPYPCRHIVFIYPPVEWLVSDCVRPPVRAWDWSIPCCPLATPCNSENLPRFPRAFFLRDRYNQGDETRPFPSVRKLLYSGGIGAASSAEGLKCQVFRRKPRSRPGNQRLRGQQWKLP